MIPLALLALTQSSLDRKIELCPPVTSVSVICRELSEMLKAEIQASPEVGREIVGIAVKDVTVRELLNRLGEAIDAEVVRTQKGWDIVRTAEHAAGRQEREIRNRGVMLRQAITATEEASGGEGVFNDSMAKDLAARVGAQWIQRSAGKSMESFRNLHSLSNRTPVRRFALQAFKALPVGELAKLTPGQQRVFCDNPNRQQRQLPSTVRRLVQDLIAEQGRYLAAIAQYVKPGQASLGFYGLTTDLLRAISIGTKPVIIAKALRDGGWECEVIGVSPNGTLAFRTFLSIESPRPTADAIQGSDSPTVQLDSSAFELRTAIENGLRSQPIEPTASVMDAAVEVGTREPLETYLGPLVRSIHENSRANVIAVGDDILMASLHGFWSSAKQPLRLAERFLTERDRELIVDGDWRIYRSRCPIVASEETASRPKLGNFLRQLRKDGFLSADAYSGLAVEHPGAVALPIARMLGLVAAPYSAPNDFPGDLSATRVFGMLSKDERATLVSGGEVAGLLLRPKLRREIEQGMMSASARVYYTSMEDEAYMREGKNVGSERLSKLEPTFACPNGLDSDARIFLSRSIGKSLFSRKLHVPGNNYQGDRTEGSGTIAQFIFDSQVQPGEGMGTQDLLRFRFGEMTQWHFRIQLTPELRMVYSLYDNRMQQVPYMKLGDLPKEFQDDIAKQVDAMRARNAGSSNPPPPTVP